MLQALEGFVEREHVVRPFRRDKLGGVDIGGYHTPAALSGVPVLGVIDENSPHRAGGHGKEMLRVVPLDLLDAEQAKKCLADKPGGFQRVALGFSGKLAVCDQPELTMKEGEHFMERIPVSQACRVEQPGNFSIFRNEASRSAAVPRNPPHHNACTYHQRARRDSNP